MTKHQQKMRKLFDDHFKINVDTKITSSFATSCFPQRTQMFGEAENSFFGLKFINCI